MLATDHVNTPIGLLQARRSLIPTQAQAKARERQILVGNLPVRSSFGSNSNGLLSLPPEHVRRSAIAHFRENYASTLLSFIPPQQLIEDELGNNLPVSLLLCIVALALR